MREKIERYFQRLESLSTVELASSAERIVATERRHVAAVIAHLAEILRRKAYLELGYKTRFDYCGKRLRLSEGGAWTRLQVANVARQFPQVLEHLVEGKVSLTVLALLAPRLKEENVERLLADVEGKTKRATKDYLTALFEPKSALEPAIRRKPTRSEGKLESEPETLEKGSRSWGEPKNESAAAETSSAAERPQPQPRGTLEAAGPELYNFRFSAERRFREKLERLGEVLGIHDPEKRMAEVFEIALDLALEKKDPKKKLERRRKRERAGSESRPAEVPENGGAGERKNSRRPPDSVRQCALERAGYQCEYRGPGGVRCTQRTGLEIDHIEPYAKGGSTSERNLRVLCKSHKLLVAAREYGEAFMRGKVEERKNAQSSKSAETAEREVLQLA